MLTEEQKSRLNPEQLAIAEKWERVQEYRLACLDRMDKANSIRDTEGYKKALDEYLDADRGKTHCEHERSIWSNCGACNEIYRLLNPEYYCSKCHESLMEDDGPPLVQGICDYCSQSEDGI